MVLIICISSDDALFVQSFIKNIFDSIRCIQRTRFSFEKKFKGD